MYRQDLTMAPLDLRTARKLAAVAGKFQAGSWIDDGRHRVEASSVIGLMTLELHPDRVVLLLTDGRDEEAAARAITEWLRAEKMGSR